MLRFHIMRLRPIPLVDTRVPSGSRKALFLVYILYYMSIVERPCADPGGSHPGSVMRPACM